METQMSKAEPTTLRSRSLLHTVFCLIYWVINVYIPYITIKTDLNSYLKWLKVKVEAPVAATPETNTC